MTGNKAQAEGPQAGVKKEGQPVLMEAPNSCVEKKEHKKRQCNKLYEATKHLD